MARKTDEEKKRILAIFADRLKGLIDEWEITQDVLGASIGVSKQAVSSYIKGDGGIDLLTLTKIANRFGVSTDYLLGRTKRKTIENKFTTRDAEQLLGLNAGACLNLHWAVEGGIDKGVFEKISDFITCALALYGEYDDFGGKELGLLSFDKQEVE